MELQKSRHRIEKMQRMRDSLFVLSFSPRYTWKSARNGHITTNMSIVEKRTLYILYIHVYVDTKLTILPIIEY